MTLVEVQKLKTGDHIFWNDPDDGSCSRSFVVASIGIRAEEDGDVLLSLTDPDGDELECLAVEIRLDTDRSVSNEKKE
jgi:hypothetical protein